MEPQNILPQTNSPFSVTLQSSMLCMCFVSGISPIEDSGPKPESLFTNHSAIRL